MLNAVKIRIVQANVTAAVHHVYAKGIKVSVPSNAIRAGLSLENAMMITASVPVSVITVRTVNVSTWTVYVPGVKDVTPERVRTTTTNVLVARAVKIQSAYSIMTTVLVARSASNRAPAKMTTANVTQQIVRRA